jgi:hypothetical protein
MPSGYSNNREFHAWLQVSTLNTGSLCTTFRRTLICGAATVISLSLITTSTDRPCKAGNLLALLAQGKPQGREIAVWYVSPT